MVESSNIINVMRRPRKCPVCGEKPVDIVYGTGDMTETEYLFAYRRQGIMGGDLIPSRPSLWACPCGCVKFRLVNADGTDAPVKLKFLSNIRRAPLSKIIWETTEVSKHSEPGRKARFYRVDFTTELGESDTLSILAYGEDSVRSLAERLVFEGGIGLQGRQIHIQRIIADPSREKN